jgi:hypothetical protein
VETNIKFGAVTVTCKTKDLFEITYRSFRKLYPDMLYIVVNGVAGDDNTTQLINLEKEDPMLKVYYFKGNICHGPGMDFAMKVLHSVYNIDHAFIFDSDVRHDKEVLSQIVPVMIANPSYYGIGRCSGTVNETGFCAKPDSYIPYIHPSRFVVNISFYMTRKPFQYHGAPCLDAMKDLYLRGESKKLIEFPIDTYIAHEWCGTRNITGVFK